MTYELYLQCDSYEESIRYDDKPNDTSTNWKFKKLGITKENFKYSPEKVTVPYKPEAGKVYFPVIVIYSTGDSFNNNYCGSMVVIDIYEDAETAHATSRAICDHEKDIDEWKSYMRSKKRKDPDKPKPKLTYKLSNGEDYVESYIPWMGYFESLDEVEVLAMIAQP